MANPNDNIYRLYQNGLKHFSLPDFETFQQDMKDEEKRRRFYTNMQEAYSLPDFDTFSQDIGAVVPPQPQQQHTQQQTASTVNPITDNTAAPAAVQPTVSTDSLASASQPEQPTGWQPTWQQRMAFDMQVRQGQEQLQRTLDEGQRRLAGVQKGNKLGAFMGEREFNPQSGQMETTYYTRQGDRVPTRMQQSQKNTEYHTWWENNTEAGRRSKEQRLQREFDDRLFHLWQRHDPTEGENAAEQAWAAAEARQKAAANAAADRTYSNYASNYPMGGPESHIVAHSNYSRETAAAKMSNFDLDRLMDDSWDNLGEEGQQALIDDCHRMLRYRYPGTDDLVLYRQAQELARQQSDLRLYNLAVEKNRPENELDYLIRKIGDMNVILSLTKAAAVSKAGTTGDMAAYEAANEEYRQDGHKILDVAGTVTGFALDPTTWLSAGVGSATAKGAMWAGGRYLAGRGATAAATKAATRQFATSMSGRIIGGVAGGAANFGTFEGLKEIEGQMVHGGHIVGQDDRGRYINEGYSASAVAGQVGHGLLMGGAIGWITPVSGNVADKLVRGTSSTVGKVAERAGMYAGATTLEGTIFSVPEWIEGNRDAMDVWTDNMAMMAGFKAKHMLKSAGGVLGDLKASFDSPANGRKNRLDFESRLRMRMDAPSDGGLALTKDERAELERYGYNDLRDLVESAERTGNAAEGSLITENAPEIVSRLTDMVTDSRISEAARAKMYYYATGRKLPESTIMRGEMVEDGNGGFIVESQGANGVITSRTFSSRKAADLELERINRQVELNHIEIGERYQQTADFENRLQDACRTVAAENGWNVVEVYRVCEEARRNHLKGVDKELDESRQNILRKVVDTMGEFEETGVTDTMRDRINEKYGVDIDAAIRKEANRRTQAEQTAIDEYLNELIPNKAKEHPVEDAEAEDITNQKLLTDEGPEYAAHGEEPIDPRFDSSTDAAPDYTGGEQKPIGRAVMKYQDRPVEVLRGRIVLTDDGTMLDNAASDKSIVIRDLATGKVEMVAPEAILSYEEYPAAPIVDSPVDNSVTETPAEEAPVTGQPKYGAGQITIRNSDGTTTQGWLTGEVDEEGKFEYYVEGDLQHLHYASEHELDSIVADFKPDAPNEPESPAENIAVPADSELKVTADPKEYEKGYTSGMQDVRNYSDEQLAAQIDKLETEAERLTDFGKGLLSAYRYELQRREAEKPQQAPQPTEAQPNAEGVPETPEIVPNPTENDVTGAENAPEAVPTVENAQEQTPLQRIPRDEHGEPLFEQAESPEIGWDALVEFSEGDAATAKEIADTMAEEKRKAFEKAQKLKPKGKTPTEILASKKANAAELAKAENEYNLWQRMAGVEQARQNAIRSQQEAEARRLAAERAEAEKAEREAREEAERLEREALEGIPEWHMDTPENARKRGVRRFSGQMFTRQEPVQGVVGNEVEVKFSQSDLPKGRVAVIEASQLQPSHIQGQRNPMFFIDEAQPKNRSEAVSTFAAQQIAEGIRPEEITGNATAYTGAPTVNTRGEVIQGNNRSDALRYLWENNLPQQQQAYKQYLIDNAGRLGFDSDAVNAMQQPVLVNMLDVDDAEAIRLGQMTAQDTESGGIERIKPKNVAQKLGEDMRMFANRLLNSSDEDASFGQLVDRNGTDVLKWMSQTGAISNTQYQSAFDSKGNITPEAKNDLQKVLYQAVFKGGSQQLEEMFDKLPAKAQRAILSTAFRDMDSPFAGKMLPEIQASIVAYNQLMEDPAFVDAKNLEQALRAIDGFKHTFLLDDRFEQYMPADNFSNFALHLAAMYKASDYTQNRLTSLFNEMYDLAQGKKGATLFEEADTTEYPLAEVIKQVLGFEYKPAKNGNNNVTNRGADVALRNQSGQGGELRGNEPPAGGEQNPAGTEPSERGAGATDDSADQNNSLGRVGDRTVDEWFGPVYTEFQGRSVEAEEYLRDKCEGVAKGALSYPGLSPIDLAWGDMTAGYMKIVIKHPEVVGKLQVILNDSTITSQSDNRIVLESDTHKVIISKKKGAIPTDNWLLTAYEKKEKPVSASSSDIETEPKGKRNGTATPQNEHFSDDKDTALSSDTQISEDKSSQQLADDKETSSVQSAVEVASAEVNTDPTSAQVEAGNYKKGHVTIGEFDITIENPAGSIRKGVDANGKAWSTTMANAYGYIKGTEGVDGDHIDVFLHQDMDKWNGRKVFVVDQSNTDGSFDEHKVMLGFNDKDEAMSAYLANYDDMWAQTHPGIRISEVSIDDFNKWVQSSHRKTKPFADYSTVSKVTERPTQSPAISGKGYKVEPKPYTNKQGKTLDTYLVTFDRDFSKEEMSALRAKAKAVKGWYDREAKGWMLRSAEEAKTFAEEVMGKSAEQIEDEAPLSMADMDKQSPVKKVNLEGVAGDLHTKGETKLSNHAEQPKSKKHSKWISDEDAAEFDDLRNNRTTFRDSILSEGGG